MGKGLISQKRFSHHTVNAPAIQPSPSSPSNFPSFFNLTIRVKGSKSGYCLLHSLHFCSSNWGGGGGEPKEKTKQINCCFIHETESVLAILTNETPKPTLSSG